MEQKSRIIPEEKFKELYDAACSAAEHSYSPYSHFPVGAALLMEDGTIIRGANIENRSFGLTNCAERSAVFTAMSAGYRSFVALVIVTPVLRFWFRRHLCRYNISSVYTRFCLTK